MSPDTLKNSKNVEELKVIEEKREAHGEALTSRKGKTSYGAQNKRAIQPGQ